jgi:hypothetical protein
MKNQNYTTSFTVDQSPEDVFAPITNVRGWWAARPNCASPTSVWCPQSSATANVQAHGAITSTTVCAA